jgi:hypothetical protein
MVVDDTFYSPAITKQQKKLKKWLDGLTGTQAFAQIVHIVTSPLDNAGLISLITTGEKEDHS